MGGASVAAMAVRQRISTTALVAWALFAATGCDDDKVQAAKLAEVQRIADEKLKKVEQAANEKVAAMQKQIDQMKAEADAEAAKLKSEADQAIAKAQGDAEAQGKAAEEALKKARSAYKAEGFQELGQLSAAKAKLVQDLAKMKQIIASIKAKVA